jgi:hypothetical protein
MSVDREYIDRIVQAAPGFQPTWERFLHEWSDEQSLPFYVAMGDLAHYIVDCYTKGDTREFGTLFETVEALYREPNAPLAELLTVGLLEDLQNVARHRNFGQDVFRPWLGSNTLKAWEDLNDFWLRVGSEQERQKPRWWEFWRRRPFDYEKALAKVESPELKRVFESNYRKQNTSKDQDRK